MDSDHRLILFRSPFSDIKLQEEADSLPEPLPELPGRLLARGHVLVGQHQPPPALQHPPAKLLSKSHGGASDDVVDFHFFLQIPITLLSFVKVFITTMN